MECALAFAKPGQEVICTKLGLDVARLAAEFAAISKNSDFVSDYWQTIDD